MESYALRKGKTRGICSANDRRSEEMSHKDTRHNFKEEEEWRVAITTLDSRDARYRPNGSGNQVGYLSLSLPPDMVTGVIRGPACSISHEELQSLLRSSGYPINVMQC
jgi:hypothetical protein